MRKFSVSVALVVLALVAAFVVIEVVAGQAADPNILKREVQGESVREITAPSAGEAPQQPNIGFIDSPSATCYQPDHTQNVCYIAWYYMYVDASPNYMITMTTFLNDFGPAARTQGFFQTSMYLPYNMLGQGFKVACGSPGASGDLQWGRAYGYTIRARDSAGLGSANYGTVYCPPFRP